MASLVLGDISAELWTAYQSRSADGRAPVAGLPPLLMERWDRSRRLGAPLEGGRAEDGLLRGEALRARAERVELLRMLGTASLDRVARELTARDHVLLLADPDGVVVGVQGGGAFAEEARRVLLIEGACCSEAARGTNAIGTAAAEGMPVTVVGHAHFARTYHGLTCVAAPIRDVDGTVRAVLDATTGALRSDPAVAEAVLATARALERLLWLEAYASVGAGVARVLSGAIEQMRGVVLLVEAPGRVERMSRAARAVVANAGSDSCEAVLGLSWQALVAEAIDPSPGGRAIEFAGPARLRAEPIVAARGGVLAVVAYVEPALVVRYRVAPPTSASVPDPFAPIFAEDPMVREQLRWARQLAASELPVMLVAETGAGKELIARAIHKASPRAGGPFLAVDCGLAPSSLASELFGEGRGASAGADPRGREGLLHAAAGGTLFVDEVAELSPALQAALLRVLEDGTVQRVGETTPDRADVRLICATCRDLSAMVAAGSFRQDLYYRLRGGVVTLPPLRARTDVVALAEHLLARWTGRAGSGPPPRIGAMAAAQLRARAWPGNVRELRSCLEVALVMARGADTLMPEHLPPELDGRRSPALAATTAPAVPLEELEARAIEAALRAANGNVSAAARSLGVARSTLYRRLRRQDG